MAYSLTLAMFLFSYVFPFCFTTSSSESVVQLIVPTNAMVNVSSGTTVRIPCVLDDKNGPVLRGQWNKNFKAILKLRNGAIVLNRDYHTVTKDGRFDLIIRDIQARDKGVYQCIESPSDEKQRLSKTLNLNVVGQGSTKSGKVKVIMPSNNEITAELGSKLVIRCPVTSETKVKTAVWQKDLLQIGEMKNGRAVFDLYYRSNVAAKPGVFNLHIPSIRTSDKGIYQCIGYDKNNNLFAGPTLNIRINSSGGLGSRPPFWKRRKDKKTFVFTPNNKLEDVPLGKTVVIRCPLVKNASEVQNATWEKNWLKIGTLANGKVVFDPPRPVTNTSVPIGIFDVVIGNVRIRDEGTYQCINLFAEGEKFSKTLKLRVPIASERPRLLQIISGLAYPVDRVRKLMVYTGRPFKLKCEAKRGHPGANLVWRVAGSLLVSNHTGPFRIQNIYGHISHTSIVEGKKNTPPLFRSTESLLEVTLPPKFNNSLIMCMAVTPLAPRKRALTRVLMVEAPDIDPNGRPSLLVNCVLLSAIVTLTCRLLVM